MAESVDEPEAEAASGAPEMSAAAALAVGVKRARAKGNTNQDAELDAFLARQGRLVELQIEDMQEQRGLILSRLRWGRLGDRVRVLLQLMTALAGLAVIVAVGAMAWSASQQRGLVVTPFTVPADLSQRGYDGQALASRFLDRLGQLQDQSYSVRTSLAFHGAEQRELKLAIPETGVSLGEVQRLLVQWLGHEVQVDGQVQASGDAVTLAVRSGDQPLITAAGAAADMGALVDKAADQAFARSQPYRYARYLQISGRIQEALARYQALALTGDAEDSAWATEAWGALIARQGDLAAGAAKEYAGARAAPDFVLYWGNLVGIEAGLGHDEAALSAARREEAAAAAGRTGQLGAAARRFMELGAREDHARLTGGFRQAVANGAAEDALWPVVEHLPISRLIFHQLQDQAEPSAQAHDAGFAAEMVRNVADSRSLLDAQAPDARREIAAELNIAAALIAASREDWPTAWRQDAAALALLGATNADATLITATATSAAAARPRETMTTTAATAAAAARAGRLADAQALAASLPADCYPCARARAAIAEASHDVPGADRAFAEAVRLAPSLPFAYVEWGRLRLAHGDPGGAIAKAAQAQKAGPDYADASELWGDALMAQGDDAGAVTRFAAADKDAPRWGRNHLDWGEALMLSGRYAEARTQFEAARGLDLSNPDRAALVVLLDRTAKGPLHG